LAWRCGRSVSHYLPDAARNAEHLPRHPYEGAQAQVKQQGYKSKDAEDD
jgi:hypothetical protein